MSFTLEFAKRMNKPSKGAPGITLRGVNGDALSCSMLLLGEDYSWIRGEVESYRISTARDIRYISRGKSLEIRTQSGKGEAPDAMGVLFDFAARIKFNTEEAADLCGFWSKAFESGSFHGLRPVNVQLISDSLSINVVCDADGEEEENAIYSAMDSIMSEYEIGVIKKHRDAL